MPIRGSARRRPAAAGVLALALAGALPPGAAPGQATGDASGPAAAAARDPLSAIDWLSLPPQTAPAGASAGFGEPPATPDARVSEIAVAPIGPASAAGAGLLPGTVTGFPAEMWRGAAAADLVEALRALPVEAGLPAMQALTHRMLLAEAAPPPGDAEAFLAARLEALIARGAVAPAREVIALLPEPRADAVLRAWADAALLEGDTAAPCAAAASRPPQAIGAALLVYCAARGGDWSHAATLLEAAHALGDIDRGGYFRLLRFLDPELAELLPELPPPPAAALTPLDYRLLVATGISLPTRALPLPFAVAEVSGDAGWRARIEAAERLVRAGAMSQRQLFDAYLHRRPAASGGVWERVAAFQDLEAALGASRHDGALPAALTRAFRLFRAHGLAVPLARQVGPRLDPARLTGEAAEAALALRLLSIGAEGAAEAEALQGPGPLAFERGLARLAPDPAASPDAMARAIAAAWERPAERAAPAARTGPALLRALAAMEAGTEGDLRALTEGLRQLRALGLESVARDAALQLRLATDPA